MRKENQLPLGTLSERRATKREDKVFNRERFKAPRFDIDHLRNTRQVYETRALFEAALLRDLEDRHRKLPETRGDQRREQLPLSRPRYKTEIKNKRLVIECTHRECDMRIPFEFEWGLGPTGKQEPKNIFFNPKTCQYKWHAYPLH